MPADDPNRLAVACLHRVLVHRARVGMGSTGLPAELLAELDQALRTGPPDPDLRMALLAVVVHQVLFASRDVRTVTEGVVACDGLMARVRDLAPRCRFLRSRAIAARLEFRPRLQFDPGRCLRALEAILTDPAVADDADLRLEFLVHRLRERLDDHDLLGIEDDLAQVIAEGEACRRLGFDPLLLQNYYWLLCGDYDRIFAAMTGRTGRRSRIALRSAEQLWRYALLAAGRIDEYEALLRREHGQLQHSGVFEQPRSSQAVAHFELQGALALARNRLDEARAALRRCHAYAESPQSYLPRQLILAVAVELAGGHAARARADLEMLDPDRRRGGCLVPWARLLLLEGDRAGAAQCFVRARERTPPGYLEHQLRSAHELSAADTMWLSRQERPADRSASRSPVPPRPIRSGTALVGDSAAMATVRRQIATFAPLQQTVLITGETGTGKECVARLLHEQGAHPGAPFLPLNCAALPDSLAESELFGHVRGAFTGADSHTPGLIAAAGEGTVFLDEIASLSPRLQGVLLRVLETGDFRAVGGERLQRRQARVVVASNQPLAEAVAAGDFRADLYYRLARFTIDVPPLRARRNDIAPLCRHFIEQASGGAAVGIAASLLQRLQAHHWPGNVRELRNEIERLLVLAPGGPELSDELPEADGSATVGGGDPTATMRGDAASSGRIPGVPAARRRRQAILDLLSQRGRLARADVVEALACAPSTATADLKALQDCRLIERVQTSGNLRTSYFVAGAIGRR